MSQRRGIATDQFINILQVIQLGRKTGRLRVERGEGAQREEGEILFDCGHVVKAHCGQLTGEHALTRLKTWGACRFIFINTVTERTTAPLPELRAFPSTDADHVALQDSGPQLRLSTHGGQGGEWSTATGPLPSTATPSGPYRLYHTEEGVQIIMQAQLSRLHRHLFLLVDGQRTLPELARLLGRRSEDVQQLLLDLEWIGVIQR
ncbi:MAG: hypothetical protein NVS2B12_25910 [Ktedonobacteraceae bacterium]